MRLSIPQSVFSDHLQIVGKAVPAKSTMQVLEGILIRSDGNAMTLTATNMEMGISTSFTVAHTEPGGVVLPAKIVDIVRRLPGESVQLTVNLDNYLTDIKSGQTEFQLYGTGPDEFPAIPQAEDQTSRCSFVINAQELKRALKQTLFAVSHDEGKPAFTGINFSLHDNILTLSSSDTFRLANTSCRVNNLLQESANILVPARVLQEAGRIFGEEDSDIKADVIKNQLILVCGATKISSRLLEENFPNVERVIPREFSGQAVIDVDAFQRAVERATLLAEGVNHVIRLSISKEQMLIRAASKFGRIQEQVAIKLEGEDLELSLNARFLSDMLKICDGEKCYLQTTGANRPCVLRDTAYEDYLYLVLPVKT
ncbi:MAG: DNA polymerase III subunit beta [Dethiobacter sp.]|nr:DNA polymerase III subunit beta [Dethiobacter sp.]